MNITDNIQSFASSIEQSIADNVFVSLSLGNYKGNEDQLKNIYIKKILIKREEKLNFTYRYKTKDIVKNYDAKEAIELTQKSLNEGFRFATLFTADFDLQLENFNNERIVVKKLKATKTAAISTEHDHAKKRIITAQDKAYLHELKITDDAGNVYKNAQDKYKQMNHYIEILSSLIKDMPQEKIKKVVDMGCGKGYLTFALYDYLTNVLKIQTEVIGVETRKDLVELCNTIAQKSKYDKLGFVEGTIEEYDSAGTNILIALHACDTATDDAIYKGINSEADLIVVAPCCHKQIRRQMEKDPTSNDIDFLTKHGIFLERQAEMVTDGMRAMILEYFGYKTKVMEFISDAHTPKNVMIVAVKNTKQVEKNEDILLQFQEAKAYFGITYHHLERLLGL
ncbi:MAG: SAM-dependent methyltransferase [Bacteroidota bacterium]|nr:SAM-dependent methyltransferase [Bacteroidota bacterium]